MSTYVDVLLPLPVEGTFTYLLPSDTAHAVVPGSRVIVPFGKRKFYSAIVVHTHHVTPPFETKEILDVLDPFPIVLPQQLQLWKWIAHYYLCALGDVYKAAMPSGLKLASESKIQLCEDFQPPRDLTPSEEKVLRALEANPTQSLQQLQRNSDVKDVMRVVQGLLDIGGLLMKEEVVRTYKPRIIQCVRVTEAYFSERSLQEVSEELYKRYPRQYDLLMTYVDMSALSAALTVDNPQILAQVTRQDLLRQSGCTSSVLQNLCKKGILEVYAQTTARLQEEALPQEMVTHPLSAPQKKAYDQILVEWETHAVCLLHGVTSSGKTEIYIHLMQEMIAQGKQVLFMLPEIVLTAQLTARLKRVFGARLGVYHSRYTDAQRVEVYQKMLSKEPYDIVVGVRSSIFLPFQRLGLIIVDEEHETSFKQQDPAPRYHARNAALILAQQVGAKTLLGSATPSIESYYNATQGKYGLVTLTSRYRDVQLPRIELVDLLEMRRKHQMKGPFSMPLIQSIEEALQAHHQVILFQNRRGYAPVLECKSCGWTPRCQRCDVSLTLHRSMRHMVCHYCGTTYDIPHTCPSCHSTQLSSRGYGTERIEDELKKLFPQARVSRMDLDTTTSRQRYEQIISDFQHGYVDILVGTQMVTKGLDFDKVSVVGILNASLMLSIPDFRAYERAFSMLEQVAGRAGRRHTQGHVVLQTMDTDAEVIRQVVDHDYLGMYKTQLAERKAFLYPPYCRIIYIYLKHRDEGIIEQLSAHVAALLRQQFGERLMGPYTPYVSWVQGMHIRQLFLKIELRYSTNAVRQFLRLVQQQVLSEKLFAQARFYYDVD